MSTKILVAYYSSTGTIHQLAQAIVAGAESTGAEVRLRRAPETAPDEAVASNDAWKAHLEATADVPEVTAEDFVWAEGYALGTPSRYGMVSAQLKSVIDALSAQWYAGDLSNKGATVFTAAQEQHGGQEATILSLNTIFFHWGAILVPPGYTGADPFIAGGNPYGASDTAGSHPDQPVPDDVLTKAKHQGARLAQVSRLLQPMREKG
jgi:NAD(P)H dehydrogenase (quinone)